MRYRRALAAGCTLVALVIAGCQPAGRYGINQPRSTRPAPRPVASKPSTEKKTERAPADLDWMLLKPAEMEAPVPIVFVHEGGDRAEWNKLKEFWTVAPTPPTPEQ